jgi:hypothetical protein
MPSLEVSSNQVQDWWLTFFFARQACKRSSILLPCHVMEKLNLVISNKSDEREASIWQ